MEEKINKKIKEIINTSYPNDYEAISFSEGFKEGIKWFQNQLINDNEEIKVCFINSLESNIYDVVEIWNLTDQEFIQKAKDFGYINSLIDFQSRWNHGDVLDGYIRFIKMN